MQDFPLRPIPRRLVRSLLAFAGAGTLMAFAVMHDGAANRWVPWAILAGSWALPLAFYGQLRQGGFDPITRLVATDAGLEAHAAGEAPRLVAWDAMRRLVQVEGYRQRAWTIYGAEPPLTWFGELEDPDGFAALVADRTGLSWELRATTPEDG